MAVDQEDRVYLMCRGENPVIIYDRDGNYKGTWGKGDFTMRTHGIYVAPNGSIFATDDGNHTVRQFTPEGKLLMTSIPVSFTDSPGSYRLPPPRLGEHTQEVLASVGLDGEHLDRVMAAGRKN